MTKIESEDIHIIARHSNWPTESIEKTLAEKVYSNADSWKKFLKFFLLTLGLGFTVAGVIFFFAYNWADLNKFVKLGLIEALIVATTIMVLLPKIKSGTKNIILTGSSFLVGALFAVFGQIYQTGADAYDFFLAWTLFITLWVIVSNFAPLWLLYIVLINTKILFKGQGSHNRAICDTSSARRCRAAQPLFSGFPSFQPKQLVSRRAQSLT